jgi:hypothetical protein
LDLDAVALRFTLDLLELLNERLFVCVRLFLFETTLLFRDGVLRLNEELRLVLPLFELTVERCLFTFRFEFMEGRVLVFPLFTVALRLLLKELLLRLFVLKELLLFFIGAPRLTLLLDSEREPLFLRTSPLLETAFFLFKEVFLSTLFFLFLPLLPSASPSRLLVFCDTMVLRLFGL